MGLSITVAKTSFKRILNEKWGLISWLFIPLIIVGLMSLISSGSGGPKPTGKLLVTDLDNTMISQFMLGGFSRGPLAEIFTVQQLKADEARQMMEDGDASAWITIEEGFAEKYLNKQQTTLQLVKNPAQSILPSMVETSLLLLIDASGYLQILFADELNEVQKIITDGDMKDSDFLALSLSVKHGIDSLEGVLFPLQIEVKKKLEKTELEKTSDKKITFGLLMFPGAMFMALMFASVSLAVSFWDEKDNGVIPRLASAPTALSHYLLGKMMNATLVFAVIALVLGTLGVLHYKMSISHIIVLSFWLVLSGLVIWSLVSSLVFIMPTKKSANIIANAMIFPMIMLGGSFFPMESMSGWMVKIGGFLPNGYMLKALKDWMIRGEALLSALLMPALMALGLILVFWFINKILLQRFVKGAHS
ncbi:MAG: ABC transporter permease [Proteobacteria bacterium]|nr:ABC transporter permease [Pseudomonadota bacterium]